MEIKTGKQKAIAAAETNSHHHLRHLTPQEDRLSEEDILLLIKERHFNLQLIYIQKKMSLYMEGNAYMFCFFLYLFQIKSVKSKYT